MKLSGFLKVLSISLLGIMPIFSLASCGGSGIRFANFESYMSADLQQKIRDDYGVQFLSYETNEILEVKFSRSYDIAVPSSYEVINLLRLGQLKKIDWLKFDLMKPGTTDAPIVNGEDAMSLLSDSAASLIEQISEANKSILPPDCNILDFAIPYFLQSFIFGYKGEEIPELAVPGITTSQVMNVIKENDRFRPSSTSHIGIVDDSRSLYGFSRLASGETKVNPENQDESCTIPELKKQYEKFTSNFKGGDCNLNSDSGILVSAFVEELGLSSLLAYNGDLLYAATGAEERDAFTPDEYHVCDVDNALLALDMVVINNNVSATNKVDKVYDVVKATILDGLGGTDDISEVDENDEYVFGPMSNFDYVMYTSPMKKINDYVLDNTEDGYFYEDTLSKEQIDMFIEIYNIKLTADSINQIEIPLKDLSKSNMSIAWSACKGSL